MSGMVRLLCTLGFCGAICVAVGVAGAAGAPEWNPVRTHAVQIGPEAGRLVVGFRATAGNAVTKVGGILSGGIGQFEHTPVRINLYRSHLLHAIR